MKENTNEKNTEPLDEIDAQILKALVENSKIPYAELARNMELSRAAITNRVNSLIAKGVISRFTLELDPKRLHLDIIVLFEVITKPQRTQAIIEILTQHEEIGQIMMTGASGIFAFAYFQDSRHLNAYLINRLSVIEGVQEIKTNVILGASKGGSLIR